MSPCPEHEPMLQALLDGELDAANTLAMETHLKTCPGCAAHLRDLEALREQLGADGLRPAAPAYLRGRIEAMIEAEGRAPARTPQPGRRWGFAALWASGGALAGALAASALLIAPIGTMTTASLEDQFVAGHVRSLEANHLIDVATSDRHVVRPWFNGKIDFAPPVPELADQGFPLAGGRLDYADNRVVAAVVYRRRAHVINLFILPARPRRFSLPTRPPAGYSVVHWTRGGLDFWAVSDVEGGELDDFRKAFEARAPS